MKPDRKVTLYTRFVDEWSTCRLCPAASGRSRVVQFRGKIPCDIAFVGEAPGESEDTNGKPFAKGAPAGKLLEYIVKNSVPPEFRVGFMNLVGCIPRDEGNRKATEPSVESIMACQPRLVQLLEIARPSMVVAVGKHAKDYLDSGYLHSIKLPSDVIVCNIIHPAAIIRMSVAMQGFKVQEAIVIISRTIEDMLEQREAAEKKAQKPKSRVR